MSTDPVAKLFYGYTKPIDEDKVEDDDEYEETPWSKAHIKSSHGCTVNLYGSSGSLGYFLAVEESLQKAAWDTVKPVDLIELGVQSLQKPWNGMLRLAAAEFGIDITGLPLGWHLVCLYF